MGPARVLLSPWMGPFAIGSVRWALRWRPRASEPGRVAAVELRAPLERPQLPAGLLEVGPLLGVSELGELLGGGRAQVRDVEHPQDFLLVEPSGFHGIHGLLEAPRDAVAE